MSPAGKAFFRRPRALIAASSLALLFAAGAPAIEVDRAELEKSGRERIVFINYEGPHSTIDSAEDILGIGRALGAAVKAGATKAGDQRRYWAAHSVEAGNAGTALDADVVALGVDAGVDHIRNLRLILRGFLEAAYGYGAKDAALLAEFATVYNAVHRGDWEYYSGKYSPKALGTLDKTKVGLSVRFDEWPGRAMIVIPLSSGAQGGSLSTVDTSPLTEKKVVDELRKKDDMGIDSRKDMVDLKEREAADAKQKAQLEREAIVAEEKKIAEEKAALQADKDKAAADRAAVDKAEREAAAKPKAESGTPAAAEEKKAEAERQAAKEQVAEKEKEIAAKEEAVAKQEAAVEQKKEEAAKTEALAEKKSSEASAERKDIAADQQKVISKEEAAAAAEPKPTGELTMKMLSNDAPFARFVILDVNSLSEIKASAIDTVRSRSIAEIGGKIVAVAGKTGGNGAVRLISVDKESLEMVAQGEDDIDPNSPVWVSGDAVYAIAVSGGALKLGLYGADLKRKAISKETLHPFAALRFVAGFVLTQAADGSPLVLNAADLTAAPKR